MSKHFKTFGLSDFLWKIINPEEFKKLPGIYQEKFEFNKFVDCQPENRNIDPLTNCLFSYCPQQEMNIFEQLSTGWIPLQVSETTISKCSLEQQCSKELRFRKICRNTHSMEIFLKYRWRPRLATAPSGDSLFNRSFLFKMSETHLTRRVNWVGRSCSVSTYFSESVVTRF